MSYLRKRKKKKIKYPIHIIYDDREKKPWRLDKRLFSMTRERLKIGDYTIEGFEDKFTIEKKANWNEFLIDISGRNRDWFKGFLNRLSKCEYRYIIIEDSYSNLKKAIATLPKKAKLTEHSVNYWITYIMVQYNIPVLLVGKSNNRIISVVTHILTHLMEFKL